MTNTLPKKVAGILSAAAVILPLAGSFAADIAWDNPTSGNFIDDANWVGGVEPSVDDNAIIANGGTAVVQDTNDVVVLTINVNGGSTVSHTGGSVITLDASGGDENLRGFNIGSVLEETGTYNAGGTAVLSGGGARIGFNGGTGVVNLSGGAKYESASGRDTWLGNGAGSSGTLNLSDTAEWKVVGNAIVVGRAGGEGALNMSGSSKLIGDANRVYLGDGAGTVSTTLLENNASITWAGTTIAGNGGAESTVTVRDDARITLTAGELWVGQGDGSKGTMSIEDDAIVIAQDDWIAIGREGGDANVTVSGNGRLEKAGPSANRHFVIGDKAKGVLTVRDTAQVVSNGDIVVGANNASGDGTFNIEGGTVTVGGWTKIGAGGGSKGSMSISGTSTINTGGTFIVGDNGTGSLTMDGGIVSTTRQTWVGQSGGGVGVFTLNGGTYSSGEWIAVGREGAQGTLNVNGGTLSHTGAGTVIDERLDGSNFVVIGSAEKVAVVNHTDGVINNTTSILAIGEGGGNVATWTASGGTANLGGLRVGFSGLGTLTIQGTAAYSATSVYLSSNGGSTGHLILNGGSLTANFIEEGAGTGTIVFNGGILRAAQATPTNESFLADFEVEDIDVQAGGLKFDTNNHAVIISHGLAGVGGLTKLGTGALTMSGFNTFAGASAVEAGTLVIAEAGALDGVTSLAVTGGAALKLQNAVSLNDEIILSLADGSSLVLDFEGTETIGALWLGDEGFLAVDTYTLAELAAFDSGVDFTGSNPNAILNVTSAVPEPTTFALLAGGMALIVWRLRRRNHA